MMFSIHLVAKVDNFLSFCDQLQLKVGAAAEGLSIAITYIKLVHWLSLSYFFNQIKPSRVVESHFENAIVNLSKVVSNITKYIFGLTVFSQINLLHQLTGRYQASPALPFKMLADFLSCIIFMNEKEALLYINSTKPPSIKLTKNG